MRKGAARLSKGPKVENGTLAYPKPRDAVKSKLNVKTGHYTGKVRLKGAALTKLRQDIYANAQGICQMCGKFAGWYWGELHHRVHRSLGGSDTLENCQWLCNACHHLEHNPRRAK